MVGRIRADHAHGGLAGEGDFAGEDEVAIAVLLANGFGFFIHE